jgi:hypothetical protein
MMHDHVGFIISHCSIERAFLDAQLEQCSKVSPHIVVSYGNMLYDGTHEDCDVYMSPLKAKYPHVRFVQYGVDLVKDPFSFPGVVKRPSAYWHNMARWTGFQSMDPSVGWLFLIDGDEIPEGERVNEWLEASSLKKNYVYKLANYWYFKLPVFQAQTHEDSVLLLHRDYLCFDNVFHDDERDGILKMSQAPQARMVYGLDGRPMFHHYSFVRSPEGLAAKLRSWAHRDDMFKGADINQIIAFVYRNDEVNDFVHGYAYSTVANQFNISL